MLFVGIWYDQNHEIKRDRVEANSQYEAMQRLYMMYRSLGDPDPGPTLTVYPEGDGSAAHTEVSSTWP